MSRTLPVLAAALCAAVVLLAEPQRCLAARTPAAVKKIEEVLGKPTQLEFIETPLQEVVDYLKDYHQIEIQIDQKALDDVGIGSDTPVTKNLKGISLRSALNLVLRDLDLTYLIEDEVLQIITVKEAGSRLSTKVYPVADLITSRKEPTQFPGDLNTLIHVITLTIARDNWINGPNFRAGSMGPVYGTGYSGYAPGYQAPGGVCRDKAEVGGKGSIAGAAFGGVEILIVSQTHHVHRQIAALLEELRGLAGKKQSAAKAAPKQ